MTEMKKVSIIRSQESVVLRGIAKKIEEIGDAVEILDAKKVDVFQAEKSTDLFILCVTPDMTSEAADREHTKNLIDNLDTCEIKTIIVGDELQLEGMAAEIMALGNFVWIKRPVDMGELEMRVKKFLSPDFKDVTKRILLVDDDTAYGRTIRNWLKDEFQISVVTTGMQAISFLMKKEVDLILLDYEMPVADGPKVMEMLKSEEETASIPVVFLTGARTKAQVNRVLALKPQGYVLKDITKADLLQYLRHTFVVLEKEKAGEE